MAGVSAALTIGSALASAVGSFAQGKAEAAQAEANAAVYEAQARNIESAQKITDRQFATKKAVLRGEATANAARSGLKISGTTANSISQSIMELQMDNSYEQYNLAVKKHNAMSDAMLERYRGKQAKSNALFKAGASALEAGASYYDKYWGNKSSSNSSSNVSSWFKGVSNKISSWKNTRLSGGLPTTNSQLFKSSSSRGDLLA